MIHKSISSWITKEFQNLPLRRKLAALITAIGFVVIFLALAVSFIFELRHFHDHLLRHYQTAARVIASNLSSSISFEDPLDAMDVIEKTNAMPQIMEVDVYTNQGMLLAHLRHRDSDSTIPPLPFSTQTYSSLETLTLTEPIMEGDSQIGKLIFQVNLHEFRNFIIKRSVLLVLVGIIMVTMAVFFASISARYITKPILELSKTAAEITKDKDFSRRQERTFNDETGQLVDSFNEMMQEIELQNKRVRTSQLRFRRYFELGVVGMAILDEDFHWLECNALFEKMLGYHLEELKNHSWMELLKLDAEAPDKHEFQKVIDGKQDHCTGEFWFKTRNEQDVFALISLRRVPGQEDDSHEYIVLVQDITERKRHEEALTEAKEQAEASNKAKDAFLGVMSHELRTPLNPILGYGELLSESLHAPEDKQALSIMMQSGHHLLDLIDRILNYIRIDKKKEPIKYTWINLQRLGEDIIHSMFQTAQDKGLELRFHFDPGELQLAEDECLLISSDHTRLQQVILNLVNNALKFTTSGHIELKIEIQTTSDKQAHIKCSVCDSGIGISKPDQEYIFQPFTQVEEVTTRNQGGIGLGLAISKQIVQSLGGNISVGSEPGKGSCFHFTFDAPYRTEQLTQADKLNAKRKFSHLIKPVLLVEDNPQNMAVQQAFLKRFGLKVACAHDGIEAIDTLEKGDFSLILMDLQMPRMGGIEATSIIRTKSELKGLPIIALTAHVSEFRKDQCLTAGMNDYLTKPFQASQLEHVLDKWLPKNT